MEEQKMKGYITRPVARETDKAYLVKQAVNNRRDGTQIKLRWVPKSVCKCTRHTFICGYDFGIETEVPETWVSEGRW